MRLVRGIEERANCLLVYTGQLARPVQRTYTSIVSVCLSFSSQSVRYMTHHSQHLAASSQFTINENIKQRPTVPRTENYVPKSTRNCITFSPDITGGSRLL